MTIPYLQILMLLAAAIFFWRAAEMEDAPGWIWTVLSVLLSLLTLFRWHETWRGFILGQLALFVGITLYRMRSKK